MIKSEKGAIEMNPIRVMERVIFEKGLKKRTVAEQIGLTPQQFSDLLNGRRRLKSTDVLPICEALDISPDELYGYDKLA